MTLSFPARRSSELPVAADRHGQPFDAALAAADGERVEQRLCGVLVPPVACVQHRAVDLLGDQRDRARCVMPYDDDVRPHGIERQRGVQQRLALLTLDDATAMLTTSAPSLLPAISKDSSVRVEFSKKALIWVRPLSRPSCFAVPRFTVTQASASSSR